MSKFWRIVQLCLYLTGAHEATLSQCFEISGKVTDSKTGKPLAGAVVSGLAIRGEILNKSISSENGSYRLKNACKINDIIIESDGYYTKKMQVINLNETASATVFHVPVTLSHIPAQGTDYPYDQQTQKHTELSMIPPGKIPVKLSIKIADAETGALVHDALTCLISTQTGKKQCYKSSHDWFASFAQTDIIALEVTASEYNSFFGNIIIDAQSTLSIADTIHLNRRRSVLSVSGETKETLELVGDKTSVSLHSESSKNQHITVLPGQYRLRLAPSGRQLDSLILSEGINLMTLQVLADTGTTKSPADSVLLYFRQSDYNLSSKTLSVLDSLATYLAVHPMQKISITGHTDGVGNPKLNQTLSEFRAKVVYNYLISKQVKASQMIYTGKGIRLPIKPNDVEEHRKWNRRVVIRHMDNFETPAVP